MDRGLQERLVGAAVLVALGVWIIPWVLDGSAVSEPTQIDTAVLKLPAPEESGGSALRRQTIELTANRDSLLKRTADATVAPAGAPQTEVTEPPQSSPARTATPVAESRPAPQSAAAVEPEAPDSAVESPADAATVARIPAASPVVGWMVQLGSFGNAGNAQRQAQRIETLGHEAQIYEFASTGGRTMFRVRLGPLNTRERAEAAASSLAAHGFVAQLVAPQ